MERMTDPNPYRPGTDDSTAKPETGCVWNILLFLLMVIIASVFVFSGSTTERIDEPEIVDVEE